MTKPKCSIFWSNLRNDSSLLCLPVFFTAKIRRQVLSNRIVSPFSRAKSLKIRFERQKTRRMSCLFFSSNQDTSVRESTPRRKEEKGFPFFVPSSRFLLRKGKEQEGASGRFSLHQRRKAQGKRRKERLLFLFFDFDGGRKRVEGGRKGKRQILLFFFRGRR